MCLLAIVDILKTSNRNRGTWYRANRIYRFRMLVTYGSRTCLPVRVVQ